MFLPRKLVVSTFVAWMMSSMSFTTTQAKLDLNGWYTCSSITFQEDLPIGADGQLSSGPTANCATFKAPLCYDGVCTAGSNQTVEIFVKRVTASDPAGKPNVFFMQGGPGASSTAMESGMISLFNLLGSKVNVYTMDHRGTGRSTKLDCVAAQAQTSGSPSGSVIDPEEVANCATELHERYGDDLASFSITSAASDLHYFISNYLTDSDTFVYGVSYGTSLVERLIHLNTSEIKGYILDGVSTTSGGDVKDFEYFSTWDPDYDEVGQYFLSFCEKNQADCGKYFTGTSVGQTLQTLMKNLEDKKYKCYKIVNVGLGSLFGSDTNPAENLRMLLGRLLASATTRTLIPVLTYRLTRCNEDDQNVFAHFVETLGPTLSQMYEDDWFTSDLLYKLIVYSEFWESPAPTMETLLERFEKTTISSGTYSDVPVYCAFTKDDTPACTEYKTYMSYEAKPIIYKKDEYWNVAAKPKDASVLLLSSKMDPQTPHKYAERLYKNLNTDAKELVTFEIATHGTLWSTPMSDGSDKATCGMQILGSYVKNGGDLSKLDKSCVAKLPAVNFKVRQDILVEWLNSTSAFDGAYDGTIPDLINTANNDDGALSTYKAVFIVFLILSIIGIVAAVVFFVKYRRAKSESKAKDIQIYNQSFE